MKIKFSILFILMLIFSCSFCYAQSWTFDDFIYYCEIVTNDTNAPTKFRNKAQQIIDNQQGFRTNLGSLTYTNWVVDVNSGYLKFQVHNGTLTLANNQQNNMIKFSNATFREYYKSGNSFDNGNNAGISYLVYDTYFGLLDLNQDYSFPGSAWFNNKYVEPVRIYFEPKDNTLINIYNNGVLTNQAYRLEFGYVYPTTALLGSIRGLPENVYGVECYYGPAVYYSGDSYISDGTRFSFNYNLYKGLYTNYLYFDEDTGQISVNSSRLLENQLYFLTVYYKETYDGEWQNLEYDIPFYAVKYTSNITSGDAINPDLEHTVDIDFVNGLDEFFGNDSNSDYLINNQFPLSGDLFSGDFFGITYDNYDDFGFGDFVYNFFISLYNVLSNYDNVTINFGILGDISSSLFIINNTVVSTFIGIFSTIFFIIDYSRL